MCRWMSILILAVAMCVESLAQPPAPTTRPTTTPALPTAIRNEIRRLESRPLAQRPYNISELVTLKLEGGRLVATAGPALAQIPTTARFTVDALGGQWLITSRSSDSFTLTRYDFDKINDAGPWRVDLIVSGSSLTIRGYGGIERRIGVHLTFREEDVFCGVCPNAGRPTFSHQGRCLSDLRRLNPELMRAYVRPMITRFGGPNPFAVPATAAYRAFPDIAPDPAVARRVAQVLSRFDSDLADDRERASRDLAALGAPGVLAAMRIDHANLSPEQLARIQQFLADNDDSRAVDPQAALNDKEFLLDCLEFDDVNIRTAAKFALGRLLHQSIDFDVTSPPQSRAAAVDRLWLDMSVIPIIRPAAPAAAPTN